MNCATQPVKFTLVLGFFLWAGGLCVLSYHATTYLMLLFEYGPPRVFSERIHPIEFKPTIKLSNGATWSELKMFAHFIFSGALWAVLVWLTKKPVRRWIGCLADYRQD
jgi:hypothetical protein